MGMIMTLYSDSSNISTHNFGLFHLEIHLKNWNLLNLISFRMKIVKFFYAGGMKTIQINQAQERARKMIKIYLLSKDCLFFTWII